MRDSAVHRQCDLRGVGWDCRFLGWFCSASGLLASLFVYRSGCNFFSRILGFSTLLDALFDVFVLTFVFVGPFRHELTLRELCARELRNERTQVGPEETPGPAFCAGPSEWADYSVTRLLGSSHSLFGLESTLTSTPSRPTRTSTSRSRIRSRNLVRSTP